MQKYTYITKVNQRKPKLKDPAFFLQLYHSEFARVNQFGRCCLRKN
jgi:hypothetical protein